MPASTPSAPKFVDYIDMLPAPPKNHESLQHTWEQLREMSERLAIPIITHEQKRKRSHDIVHRI